MTETNPFPKFSRAWFAWNGKKGGKAGTGEAKRRSHLHYVNLSKLGVKVRLTPK